MNKRFGIGRRSEVQQQPPPSSNGNGGNGSVERKPPVLELRSGLIKATVWMNQGDKGEWPSISLTRSYRQGEEWKTAQTLGKSDLLEAAELLKKVWEVLTFESEEGGDQPF